MKKYFRFILIILIIVAMLQISCSFKKDLVFEDNHKISSGEYERANWDFRDLMLGSILKVQNMYWLYYSGANYYYKYNVGVAESSDFKKWSKYSLNPIITRDDNLALESIGIQTMFVVFKDGKYCMWYDSVNARAVTSICYATSEDGINWKKYDKNPVIKPEKDWESRGVFDCSVIFDNGEYLMWYSGIDKYSNIKIGYATSDDGINWQKYDKNPVIKPDSNNHYEEISVLEPSVFIFNNNFYMVYTSYGTGSMGDSFINIATSEDGINWKKYDKNPVIKPEKDWESAGVYEPTIYFNNRTIEMLYSGNDGTADGRVVKVGLASSVDGINWVKESKTNLYAYMNDMNY
jgi:predicted GH43/DUF377 family glycosyl hydrolase